MFQVLLFKRIFDRREAYFHYKRNSAELSREIHIDADRLLDLVL